MTIKRFTLMLTTALLSLLFSCSNESGIPQTLQNIMDRQGVSTNGGGSTKSGSGTGNGDNYVSYSGAYASDVKLLLSHVSGWKTYSCLTCNDGVPPRVDKNSNCQRDFYVAAAVSFAWAAENYYRLGQMSNAVAQATNMNSQLQMVKRLCGSGPTINGAGSCLTTWYSC